MNKLETANNNTLSLKSLSPTSKNDPISSLTQNYLSGTNSMYDNVGKYFDQNLFNKKFDQYIEKKNKERLTDQEVKTHDLTKNENLVIAPYELPLNKILINVKDTWFQIYDDIAKQKNPIESFNNDTIFYLGISLIAISLLYIMIFYIFE